MTDPSEIRYAKIQERLEPCVTELNIKNKTVKVDWYIPIEFCHTKGTIAHGGTVSFILDASMFFAVDLIHKGFTTGLTLGLNIQYLNMELKITCIFIFSNAFSACSLLKILFLVRI